MQALLDEAPAPPELRFWGTWLPIDQQPPLAGSELLLTICKQARPLLIVDPFRYFHNGEENDSTAMAGVMQYLRACASYGAAVVILHHPAKTEGSTGRGSSAIRGACDVAFLHSLDKESGLITLKVDKNRLGPSRTFTIRADFEEGVFEMSEAPYIVRRNDELARLEEIIRANPGITHNAICKQLGGRRNRIGKLLKEGTGTRWTVENGKHGANQYHLVAKSLYPKGGTADTSSFEETGIAVPTPLGVVLDTGRREGKGLPSSEKCGSFALQDGICQTCEGW
jgi:hypothetical protein